jgi:hypothetical protein
LVSITSSLCEEADHLFAVLVNNPLNKVADPLTVRLRLDPQLQVLGT